MPAPGRQRARTKWSHAGPACLSLPVLGKPGPDHRASGLEEPLPFQNTFRAPSFPSLAGLQPWMLRAAGRDLVSAQDQ